MKVDVNQIPFEGLTLEGEVSPQALDLETEIIKVRGPVIAKASIWRITNAVTISLSLEALLYTNCSRCMSEFEINFKKVANLNYQADKAEPVIDLDPEIREEIILDYPVKPLCRPDCKGLCADCGKNLNEGNCSCKRERAN